MKSLRFGSLLVIMFSISLLADRAVSRRILKSKVKKQELAIDLEDPFYSAKFDPCKKTRRFDPVELVKAQAFSAQMFQKCGPKMIVKLASRWRFPAWGKGCRVSIALIRVPFPLDYNLLTVGKLLYDFAGIMPLTRLGCVAIHMGFGFLASDGTIIIPDSTKSSEVIDLVNYYWPALEKSGYKIRLKSDNATYTVSNQAIWELVEEGIHCFLSAEYVEETDGDYYKHAINHVRFMLL